MLAGSVLTSNRLGIFFVVVVTEAESFEDSISCIPSIEHTLALLANFKQTLWQTVLGKPEEFTCVCHSLKFEDIGTGLRNNYDPKSPQSAMHYSVTFVNPISTSPPPPPPPPLPLPAPVLIHAMQS